MQSETKRALIYSFCILAVVITAGLFSSSKAGATECVANSAYTEVIAGTPEVAAVYEDVLVTEGSRVDYIYNGEWSSSEAPQYPGDDWSLYTGEPNNVRFHDSGSYFVPMDQEGNGTWFYMSVTQPVFESRIVSEAIQAIPDQRIEHPAIICESIEEAPIQPVDVVEPVVEEVVMPSEAPEGVLEDLDPISEPIVQDVYVNPSESVLSTELPTELAATGLGESLNDHPGALIMVIFGGATFGAGMIILLVLFLTRK